jgi:NAD dependent epimerase/dehydratase family enzyme
MLSSLTLWLLLRWERRPTLPRLDAFFDVFMQTALGELAGQLIGDMYAVPQRLVGNGFVFSDPTVEDVVGSALRSAGRH